MFILLYQCKINLTVIYFLQISDLLLSTESIIPIVCRHMSQFQSTNVPETPSFLRILATKKAHNVLTKFDHNIKSLEQPNIIFGVGAGGQYLCFIYDKYVVILNINNVLLKSKKSLFVPVLSYAELADLSAKLYILYIDSFVLDSKCAEPILQVLTNEIHCELHPKFAENFFSKGNLYM